MRQVVFQPVGGTDMSRYTYVVIDSGSTIGPFSCFESADAFRLAHAPSAAIKVLWSPDDAKRMLL